MKTPETAKECEWDFHGSCAPKEDEPGPVFSGQKTFTLGCFQWVRRGKNGSGKGLKKGAVQFRIHGQCEDPSPAYRAARSFCANKNERASE